MSVVAVAELGRGVVPVDEPVVFVDDEAVLRGRAVFETMRVYDGVPFRLDDHLDRLGVSAARVHLPEPDRGAFAAAALATIEVAATRDATLRFLWTPGREGARSPHGYVLVSMLPPGLEALRARGLRLATRQWAAGALAAAKTTSYAENIVAQDDAVRAGFDDALLVAPDGIVLEAPTANVWFREGDTLLTPAQSLRLLSGVTRRVLCGLAPALGYVVDEGRYDLDRLLAAEEVFLSSSVREVMPVAAVDDRDFAPGPAAAVLQEGLRQVAGGYPEGE